MAATATAPVITKYPEIETAVIESSGLNPRTHWDKASDAELQASIRADGVLEPIIVRPHPTKAERFQIVAGERRFRAAYEVGLELIPAIVRDVTDEKLLELALTENIQRRSMHPLDEANGFIKRLEMGQTTPEQLANTLGLSKRYVTDRIRLKKLSPKATELLEAGGITITHAIILAKLAPKQQDEAIKSCTTYELDFESVSNNRKPVMASVAHLREWVDRNVPLDFASPATQEDFPELADEVAAAAAKGAAIVMLSDNYRPCNHKAKPGDPVFRDDWQECKKTDKHAVVGIVVEGRRRGHKLYWKPAVKAAPASSRSTSGSSAPKLSEAEKKKRADAEKREKAVREKLQREEARRGRVCLAVTLAAVEKLKTIESKPALQLLIAELANNDPDFDRQQLADALKFPQKVLDYNPSPKLLAALSVAQLVTVVVAYLVNTGYGADSVRVNCKALGIDYAAIDKRIAKEEATAAKGAALVHSLHPKKAKKR